MRKKPETPEEQWAAIARLAEDDEDDDVSDEEVDAALRAAGYDVEKVDARAAAFAASVHAELDAMEARAGAVPAAPASGPNVGLGGDGSVGAPAAVPMLNVAPPEPRPRRRWPLALLVAAIAAMLAIGTAVTVATRDKPWVDPTVPERPSPRPETPHEPTPVELAANARSEAKAACAKKDWVLCTARLDDAARMDPDGELAPEVQTLRSAVNAAAVEDEKKKGKGGK